MNDDGPSVLTMIGAVALIVALVILVFFAAGYGFGRLFCEAGNLQEHTLPKLDRAFFAR